MTHKKKEPPQRSADSPINILVVEDNDLTRELFRTALCAQYTIYTATGVEEGWAIYTKDKPDICFIDIRLPDGTGHDLTKRIKALDPEAYVIIATVNDYEEEREEAARNHADGFIAKPYSLQEINDCIERFRSVHERKG